MYSFKCGFHNTIIYQNKFKSLVEKSRVALWIRGIGLAVRLQAFRNSLMARQHDSHMISRKLIADTFAMVTFSTIVGIIIELGIAGLTLPQSIHARVLAIPVNVLTGRPNAVFRDFLVKKIRAEKAGQIKKALVDVAAFVLFQVPLYALVLFLSGATISQIIVASGTVVVFSTISGRPYGIFLGLSRKLFKVQK